MAKHIVGEEGYLDKLDITVQRNSFGRQVDSFESELNVQGIAEDIEGVFIRRRILKRHTVRYQC